MIFGFVVVVINSVQAQDQAEQSLFLPFCCFFLVFVGCFSSTCTNSNYIVLFVLNTIQILPYCWGGPVSQPPLSYILLHPYPFIIFFQFQEVSSGYWHLSYHYIYIENNSIKTTCLYLVCENTIIQPWAELSCETLSSSSASYARCAEVFSAVLSN